MLAQTYQIDFRSRIPVVTIAELGERRRIRRNTGKNTAARRIQDLIMERLNTGKSFHDLLLQGWVYQFWRAKERCPTVTEIAKLMGLSRQAFYRRYSITELYKAYRTAANRTEPAPPDPDGFDEAQ